MKKEELLNIIKDMPDDADILLNDGFDFDLKYDSSHNDSVEYCELDKEHNTIILTHWL